MNPILFAQQQPDAGQALGGLLCCFLLVGLPLSIFALNIAMLFWVAKDAKSRGMDGAMWIFLVLFTGFLGLAIYLFSRPQGMLVQCDNCGNNRLEASVKCPHCGSRSGNGRDDRPRRRRSRDDDDDDDDD